MLITIILELLLTNYLVFAFIFLHIFFINVNNIIGWWEMAKNKSSKSSNNMNKNSKASSSMNNSKSANANSNNMNSNNANKNSLN